MPAKRTLLLPFLLIAALSCASEDPPQTAEKEPVEVPKKRPEITIDSINASNPIVVKGTARTFENAVSLHVRNARGELIGENHVTSVGEMGHHNPFEAQLWIVQNPGERITVEAFEYSARDGSIQSLTSKAVAFPVEIIPATLMFPAGDCTRLAAFERRLPKSVAMARLLTEALVAGPDSREKSAGATAPFPRGSAVRSVILREGKLTVDFNERLQNVGGSCAALGIRESVVRTLEKLPSVKGVTITAGGSRELALQP